MCTHNKRGMALVYTLISIVLSLFLIMGMLKAGSNLLKDNPDNEKYLLTFQENINSLLETEVEENLFLSEDAIKTSFIQLTNDEMFMFFSQGTPQQGISLSSSQGDQLLFGRPSADECENSACICHCKDGPYWRASSIFESGIQSYKLLPGKTYYCPQPTCISLDEDSIIFANSRSYSTYNEKVKELVDLFNDQGKKENSKYFAIPWDIVLLMNYDDANEHDLFFDWSYGNDYNRARQDSDFVDYVLSYEWQGGVVIGGSGYAVDSQDKKDGFLFGPHINIKLTKEGSKNIIGVCLDIDDCITMSHYKHLEKQEDIAQEKEIIAHKFQDLENYLTRSFGDCISKANNDDSRKDCVSEIELKMKSIFEEESDTIELFLAPVSADHNSYFTFMLSQKEIIKSNSRTLVADFDVQLPSPRIKYEDELHVFEHEDIIAYTKEGFEIDFYGTGYHLYPLQIGDKYTFVFSQSE